MPEEIDENEISAEFDKNELEAEIGKNEDHHLTEEESEGEK